jgi:hypothetical protein
MNRDRGAVAIRLEIHLTVVMADALTHPRQSNTCAMRPDLGELFRRKTLAIIANLNRNTIGVTGQADRTGLAPGMPMNIGQ